MTKAQEYCNKLLAIGMHEHTISTSRYRAFVHYTMRGDQFVLVGKRGSLRVGSNTTTSVSLQPEKFIDLLDKALDNRSRVSNNKFSS